MIGGCGEGTVDPVALLLFAASARAAVVVPRCPWKLQAGRSDRCGFQGVIDGWLVFWVYLWEGSLPTFYCIWGVYGWFGRFAYCNWDSALFFLSAGVWGGFLWARSKHMCF